MMTLLKGLGLSALLLLTSILTLTYVTPAYAQTCFSEDDIQRVVVGEYDEAPIFMGLANNGAVVQLWTNEDTGTWSVVVMLPSGCIMVPAAGVDILPLPVVGTKS